MNGYDVFLFLSLRDDHSILKWNLLSDETTQVLFLQIIAQMGRYLKLLFFGSKVAQLPAENFPTDINWFPRGGGGKKQSQSDLFVLTSTDGRITAQHSIQVS